MTRKLSVRVTITPHEPQVSSRELNEMIDGELVDFERYFLRVQRERGAMNPSPLLTGERSVIKAYVMYAASKEEPAS